MFTSKKPFCKISEGTGTYLTFLPGQSGTSVSSPNCWSLKLQRIVFRSFKRFKGERANDTKNGNVKLLNKFQPTKSRLFISVNKLSQDLNEGEKHGFNFYFRKTHYMWVFFENIYWIVSVVCLAEGAVK